MSDAAPDTDTYTFPPLQAMVMEVLIARARLGEGAWTFPNGIRPALEALSVRGLVWWKSATIPKHCLAGLTATGRAVGLAHPYEPPLTRDLQDLLASIWLYIPWQWVTSQLTTEQKELFADAIDAHGARLNRADPAYRAEPVSPVERWWRD